MFVSDLRQAYKRWKIITEITGNYITQFIALVFYFTVFALFAVLAKRYADPLRRKRPTLWHDRSPIGSSLDDARQQS